MQPSKLLWIENKNLAHKSLNTNFIQGIYNGDLPVESFKNYIAQDFHFLEAFARAYAKGISICPDFYSIKILNKLLGGVIQELDLHTSYANLWDVNLDSYLLNKETKEYIDFLKSTANSGNIVNILSAMTPCMKLYSWLGCKLLKNIKTNNIYEDWIITYSSKDFYALTVTIEELMDKYAHEENLTSMRFSYTRAMELEYQFFNAYNSNEG